jgi:peptidylprolyl isomerase
MKKWLLVCVSLLSLNLLNAEGIMKNKIEKEVVFETTKGKVEICLKPDVAPKACENMIKLIQKGYYNGVIFHRVIEGFMVQTGDPTGTGRGGQSAFGKEFADEYDPSAVFNKPGILAMANRGPNTNGSQFFITTAQTPWLNHRHTIFGEVVKGYDVVVSIEKAKTDHSDKPVEEIRILKAYVKDSP